MKFETMVLGPLGVNVYVLYDDETKDAVIIDPAGDADRIIELVTGLELLPKEMWLTHGHFDHLGAATALACKYDIKLFMHDEDFPLYKNPLELSSMFGIEVEAPPSDPLFFNMNIAARDVGSFRIEIMHTPGHSPGSVSFYSRSTNEIFVGDLLFQQSVGRTDLQGGSFEMLSKSIINHVYSKGDACVIYPGHGPSTTVGRERRYNPFVNDKNR
jgi:glyoxylase-like metal-dependent hydrolase (beta-lactamase superfamily II)